MSAVRTTVRGFGELLITAGLVILLFCAYQLFWTNVESNRAQGQVLDELRDRDDPGLDEHIAELEDLRAETVARLEAAHASVG